MKRRLFGASGGPYPSILPYVGHAGGMAAGQIGELNLQELNISYILR